MLNINGLSVIIYLFVAVIVIAFGTKISRPGSARVFVFATLFSVFFSMGLVVGHGIAPLPGLLLIGYCGFTDLCTRMYGSSGGVLFYTLLPMLVQWGIILMISFGLSYLAKRTGFAQPVPIAMSEKAKIHRRIIGIAWLLFGVSWFLILIYTILKLPVNQLAQLKIPITQWDPWHTISYIMHAIVPLLCLSGGYLLLRNISWSRWLCFPSSVLALLSFPLGTAMGGYYLWYYLTIEKQT